MVPDDTICAPATPPVNSAIAIIRISGPLTHDVIKKLFPQQTDFNERHAYYLSLFDGNRIIDDVIIIFYKKPKTYTGEDMAEIFCHGNQIIVKEILQLLHRNGIRMAEPGEFTKLAFLNGKIDLTEAEAINHLIVAKSEWEISMALEQMHGSLRDAIKAIRKEAIELKADIECGIDFIEEDIEIISKESALQKLNLIGSDINNVFLKCRIGERLCHGIDITITGKPNVGKSSILNLMLNRERAIVSDIPGTTRDIIKEPLQIEGIHFNVIDTAGIDSPSNEIERIGIEMSYRNIDESALVIMVFDASNGISTADETLYEKIKHKKNCLYLINKIDIGNDSNIKSIMRILDSEPILFSAKEGYSLVDLKNKIIEFVNDKFVDTRNSFIADVRIIALLEQSICIIKELKGLIKKSEPIEIIACELNNFLDKLSEITGEITPEEVLDSLFTRFCIGK